MAKDNLVKSACQTVTNGCVEESESVSRFRKYLTIRTDHPHPDYGRCSEFLEQLAETSGVSHYKVELELGKPIFVMKIPGTHPDMTSLFLYSHTDVVPAHTEHWKYDPFGGHKDEKGDIYGRGTQDMKSVGIQYIEAIRLLLEEGRTFLRNIFIVFGPDEEIGGFDGMGKFVDHPKFKEMDVGFVLDEGVPWPDDTYRVYYGERCGWPLKVKCTGNPGHGSKFIENTAAEKLIRPLVWRRKTAVKAISLRRLRSVVNNFLNLRDREFERLQANANFTLGDVISINLTKVEGGVQINVVPTELIAHFDIRIPPTTDFKAFEKQLDDWMVEAGPGVTYEFEPYKYTVRDITKVDHSNPWWMAMKHVLDNLGLKYRTDILGGGTDSRFLRERGYPALHFSPMIHTPQLLHDHNEFVNEAVFLEGIRIYKEMIPALANLPQHYAVCNEVKIS